jgi:hypothetical protein
MDTKNNIVNNIVLFVPQSVTVAAQSKAPHTHTVWPSVRPAQMKTERQN